MGRIGARLASVNGVGRSQSHHNIGHFRLVCSESRLLFVIPSCQLYNLPLLRSFLAGDGWLYDIQSLVIQEKRVVTKEFAQLRH
jgi:hypothetical protein